MPSSKVMFYFKVLCMELQSGMGNGPVTLNLPDDASAEHTRQENGNVERIETQEKRTRFSLSHDEGISVT